MNQLQLVRNTIAKYSDFPIVQQDMRRILKYVSSWQRMGLDPIISNEPALSPKLAALDASTEVFEATEAFTAEVEADAVTIAKAIMAQVIDRKAGSFDTAKDALLLKYVGAPKTVGYLVQVAEYILHEIMELTPQQLHVIRKP
jgi:hypothetical protein